MAEVKAAYSKADIEKLLDLGGEIDIAVAYVGQYGMDIIQKKVKDNSGIKRVRLLVDLKGGVTEPEAVKTMLELSEKHGSRFECKEYYIKGDGHAGLHAKLLISNSAGSVTFLTGSSNLTENAIERNKEHGVRVECGADEPLAKDVLKYFRGLWDDAKHATAINHERYREYAEFYKGVQKVEKGKDTLDPPKKQESEVKPVSDAKYWLFKCNIERYSFKQLQKEPTDWNARDRPTAGVIEKIKKDDEVLFYEIGARQLMGTAKVVSEPYDGPLASPSKPDKRVDIKADKEFKVRVPWAILKGMGLKARPSIQPVTKEEWNEIVKMGMGTGGG